jgi:hypothetical protein
LEREKLEKIGMTGVIGCLLLISGFSFMAGLTAWGKKQSPTVKLTAKKIAKLVKYRLEIECSKKVIST